MMACRSGCKTQDHESYGDCLQAANLRIAYSGIGGGDATTQKRWDKNLADYKRARELGIQPVGTKPSQVRAAFEASDKSGKAFVGV